MKAGFERVKLTMEKQGMHFIDKTFYAGHSLGGAMLLDYVTNHASNATGMVLLGSFITRNYKTGTTKEGRPIIEFSVPSLTIGGEMDGLLRLTRVVESMYSQIVSAPSNEFDQAVKSKAVTIIEGMNHMQFASGEPPKFVLDHDLQSEVSEKDAHKNVISDMSTFLQALQGNALSSNKYWKILSKRVEDSIKFAQPIIDAFLLEGNYNYNRPCYCETKDEFGGLQFGTCVSSPSCNGGSDWTSLYAQPIMGKADGVTVKNVDSIHIVTEENPSCHLPHIHSSQYRANEIPWGNPGNIQKDEKTTDWNPYVPPLCDKPKGCVLSLTSVTEPIYDNSGEIDIFRFHFQLNTFDTGNLPLAANEMKTKLKSRESVWQAAGFTNVSSVVTDMPVDKKGNHEPCGEIIQAAIDWAMKKVPSKTRGRFEKYGQQFIVGPDIEAVCGGGPCWIWDPIKFNKDDKANTVTVQSVYTFESNKNPFPCGEEKTIPCPTGFHYCKLFSPAKAIEWIYVDGLKNKLSTKEIV